jgi:plasmid maintenance system antidote protein VapI
MNIELGMNFGSLNQFKLNLENEKELNSKSGAWAKTQRLGLARS